MLLLHREYRFQYHLITRHNVKYCWKSVRSLKTFSIFVMLDLCRITIIPFGLSKTFDSPSIVNSISMIGTLQQSTKSKQVSKCLSEIQFEKDQLTHLGVARLTTHKIHSPFLQKGKKGTMRMFSSMRRFTNSNLWILSEIILWRCVHWQELRTWWIKKAYKGLYRPLSLWALLYENE